MHDVDRLFEGEGGFVDPFAGERIEGVGDGGDAAFERNGVCFEPARISAAVELFVMCPGNGRGEINSSASEPERMR